MRKILLLCCCLFHSLLALGDAQDVQRLSEIGARSRLLCASAMAYFDPQEREPDSRGLTSVYYQLNTLDTLAVQLGNPESLRRPLRELRSTFETLDAMSRQQAEQFPALVRQLLVSGAALQQAAAEAAVGLPEQPWTQQLGAQGQAIATLLMDYQLRGYPLPEPQPFALSHEEVLRLDAEVSQRFAQLQTNFPAQAGELGKIDNTYRFVRNQLRQGNGHLSGGAGFYLARAISDLAEMASAPLE